MRTAQVSELKDRLDEVIDAVKNGEMVDIREGDTSLAEMVPSVTGPRQLARGELTELDSRALETLAKSIIVSHPRQLAKLHKTNETRGQTSGALPGEVVRREDQAIRHAVAVLSDELDQLSDYDRLIMKLRFIDAMKISTIARMLHWDQKQLYRRVDRIVAALRESLRAAGVSDQEDLLLVDSANPAPAQPDQTALKAHLDELVRKGKVRRGTGTLPADFFTRPLPKAKASVLEQLLEDRRTGR
jgi:antitoxin (DNA-binding transcriptional repressor) of toxin-antitoxin stability system